MRKISLRISTHLSAKPILTLSVHGNLSRRNPKPTPSCPRQGVFKTAYYEFGLDGSPETKLHNDSKFKAAYRRITQPSLTPTATVTIPNYPPVPFLVRSSRKPVSMIK